MGRHFLLLIGAVIMFTSAVLATPAAAAEPADFATPNGHFYSQAAGGSGGQTMAGYEINDGGGIPIWTEYQRLGGADALGYPISNRFILGGQVVQLTQKVGLVWRPEAHRVTFLDIFTLLHDAGKDGWLAAKGIPPLADVSSEAGKTWDAISQQRYTLLDANAAIKQAYFGMQDPVNMYGLPTSTWLNSPSVSTLRFENVVIQQWKQLLPWATPGQVQLANGGDLFKESGILGDEPFKLDPAPTPAPTAPTLQTAPAGFAVVSFYSDSFQGSRMSDGRVFSQANLTCATNAFPLGARLRLSTLDGAHSVIVVNEDHPAAWNTRIDLSKAAFQALYPLGRGLGSAKVEIIR